MAITGYLTAIRNEWIEEIALSLEVSKEQDKEVRSELANFYDLLIQAVDQNDFEILKPMIVAWVGEHSELELEESFISFPDKLNKIVKLTGVVAQKNLDSENALDLMQALIPVFTYAFQTVTSQELLIRIQYFSTQVEKFESDLERIDQSKSDFIAVAAHELRTPLTLIEGYTSILREKYSKLEGDVPELHMIRGINNGIRRLQEIVDDMLDASMIDNNLLTLNFQPTWLNQLFHLLNKDVSGFVKERKQTLEIKDFQGSDEMMFADPERIHQAFRNILTNAIKYTPDGGEIIVDGKKIDGYIEVSVKDNGIGIDKEDQEKIFNKFGRLGEVATHSSGKTKFKGGGPGLGLPITKGIIEAHGGKIWVESDGYDEKKYPGSTFYIHIPLRTEPPDDKVAKLFKVKH